MQEYKQQDKFSVPQILINLADFASKNKPQKSIKIIKETLDTFVDRAINAEGEKNPTQGEFFGITADILKTTPHKLNKTYKCIGDITNQYEKIITVIKHISEQHKNYFDEHNLVNTFGKEGLKIFGTYNTLMQKNFPETDFIKNSKLQHANLEMYVLNNKEFLKQGYPEIIIYKKGKKADSLAKKITKYIAEKLPFIKDEHIIHIDPYLVIAHYINGNGQDDKKTKELIGDLTINQMELLTQQHKELKINTKKLKAAKNEKEQIEKNAVQIIKKNKKYYHDQLKEFETEIKESHKQVQIIHKSLEQEIDQIRPIIENNIKKMTRREKREYLRKVMREINTPTDLRGLQLVVSPGANLDVYKQKALTSTTYIPESLDDHRSKKDRKSNYIALHTKHKAQRFKYDPTRNNYAYAEKIEVQIISVDNIVKDLIGIFNHTDYEVSKEKRATEEFTPTQLKVYNNILRRMQWASTGIEESFDRLMKVFKNDKNQYDQQLESEANILYTKWYPATKK